jgi:dsRNA-specific ribonuclease
MYAFKGKLIRYAQTRGFDLPNYTFKNEGFSHAPCFHATVDVAGHTFTAPETFKCRKDAEHFISKLAFESLSRQASHNVVSSTSFIRVTYS